MKYAQNYLTLNDSYKAAKQLIPTGIVVHSTGCNQKKISAYLWQLDRPGVRASVHGFLGLDDNGDFCYTQTLPYDIQCWGCGAGNKGSYNSSHIQFEICEDLTDGDWCRSTFEAALELCHELCEIYGISPDNVVCHSEAYAKGYGSNHGDVMHWWPQYGLSMDKFREALKDGELMNIDTIIDSITDEQAYRLMAKANAHAATLQPSAYAMESCRKAVSSGLFSDGDHDGLQDAPRAPILRQELAVILDRQGNLK